MRVAYLVAVGLGACGGGGGQSPPDATEPVDVLLADVIPVDAGEPSHGFDKPTKSLKANVEVSPDNWMEIGPADLACRGTPANDPATTVAVSITTTVRDFQSDNLVPGASVGVFPGENVAAPFAGSPQLANGNASVTLTIPVGTRRFGFDISDPSSLRTIELRHLANPSQAAQTLPAIRPISKSTAQTLPALIGVSRTPATGLVLGVMRDCQDREVSNFIATVSATAGAPDHVAGADTYYFSSSVGLPVRHSQKAAASEDGQFMVIELAPSPTGFIQVWGFLDDGDLAADILTLVAELPAPVLADTVVGGGLAPRRQ